MARILIVEDEKALNDAYQIVLKKEGHDVEAAYDGKEGLKKFKEKEADLILLDLRMPEASGIDFLKSLQPAKNKLKTKIIIFSNYDDQKEIDEAFSLGATRYILKAWSSPQELAKVVKETLANKY